MHPYHFKLKRLQEKLKMEIQVSKFGSAKGSNQVSLINLAVSSNSVSQLSIWYSDIEVWCEQNCKGEWYYGWMTYNVEGTSFSEDVCFDHPEHATLFKLSFPV